MSLIGKATAKRLRGKINKIDVIYTDTYEIAVKNGFEGTIDEWLESLKPVRGVDYWTEEDVAAIKAYIDSMSAPVRLTDVTIFASGWNDVDEGLFAQVVNMDGITEYSKVDLLPSVEQLAIFHNKDVTFVTENEDGVVTVYAIGEKPLMDYTMQAQITEVVV
jgi:hypothetical protein